ncbi:MAG: hypothetical protein WBD55_12410, partial [Dehalococcoidia bacterium]
WSHAFRELSEADEVTFVGYSLPVTYIAAGFLFGEALRHLSFSSIRVVNQTRDEELQRRIRLTYRSLFPGMRRSQFNFDGALAWSRQFVEEDLSLAEAP